jgi:hypothetical protein
MIIADIRGRRRPWIKTVFYILGRREIHDTFLLIANVHLIYA